MNLKIRLVIYQWLTSLILFLTLAPNFGWGQTNVPAPLPPAAQEALDKGITAAKLPDYLLAIRYFEGARKIAPDAPIIFLNLGLAESKIPGRELRAIAWFGAYLAAYPDAPKATAVKELIVALDLKNQSNLLHLIKSAENEVKQMSGLDEQCSRLADVAGLWVDFGDTAAVQKFADLIQMSIHPSWFKSRALTSIASAQIDAGDIVNAKINLQSSLKIADLIDKEPPTTIRSAAAAKCKMQRLIAEAQAESGDIAVAQKTANLIKDGEEKDVARANIARTQGMAGDIEGAQKTAKLIKSAEIKNSVLENIAILRAERHASIVAHPGVNAPIQAPPSPSSFDQWIAKNDGLLNFPIFLTLDAHLKSLPINNGFDGLCAAVKKITNARQVITQMLKQQAQSPTKP